MGIIIMGTRIRTEMKDDSRKESIVRFERVSALADEILGDRTKSSLWLQTPNPALKNRAPCDLLETDEDMRFVETVLGRIAHGIYS